MKDTSIIEKPLLAYSVVEDDENTGGILFAKSSAEARSLGANRWSNGEFEYVKARRAQWADQYAPGPIPMEEYLKHGWHCECCHCEQQISDDAYDDDGEPITLDPLGDFEGVAFCTPKCQHEYEIDKVLERMEKEWAIKELSMELLNKCPGVTIKKTHAYAPKRDGVFKAEQVIIYFTFPGSKIGTASYRIDRDKPIPELMVLNGDLKAWEEWRGLKNEQP